MRGSDGQFPAATGSRHANKFSQSSIVLPRSTVKLLPLIISFEFTNGQQTSFDVCFLS